MRRGKGGLIFLKILLCTFFKKLFFLEQWSWRSILSWWPPPLKIYCCDGGTHLLRKIMLIIFWMSLTPFGSILSMGWSFELTGEVFRFHTGMYNILQYFVVILCFCFVLIEIKNVTKWVNMDIYTFEMYHHLHPLGRYEKSAFIEKILLIIC